MKTPIRPGEKVVLEPRDRSLDEARWRRNAIANLAEGVTLVPAGKAASVYFRSGAQVLELAGEMGAGDVDLIVWLPAKPHWINVTSFEQIQVLPEEREQAYRSIQENLSAEGIRVVFDGPDG